MSGNYFNAIDAGLASDNSANVNAAALQRLTDSVKAGGRRNDHDPARNLCDQRNDFARSTGWLVY